MSSLALAAFALAGVLSVVCFAWSYAHLTPDAKRWGSRLTLRGPVTRQDIFTSRGFQLRMWGWAFAAAALAALLASRFLGGR